MAGRVVEKPMRIVYAAMRAVGDRIRGGLAVLGADISAKGPVMMLSVAKHASRLECGYPRHNRGLL